MAFSPILLSAIPRRTEKNKTCKISPVLKALTTFSGIMCRRKEPSVSWVSGFIKVSTLLVSKLLTSAFIPAPGFRMLTTISPMIKAQVDTTSKYKIAFSPTLPTFLVSCIPAIPVTMVQKMIGAIIILISLIKPSPSGLSSIPISGTK